MFHMKKQRKNTAFMAKREPEPPEDYYDSAELGREPGVTSRSTWLSFWSEMFAGFLGIFLLALCAGCATNIINMLDAYDSSDSLRGYSV